MARSTGQTGYEGLATPVIWDRIAKLEDEIPRAQGALALMRRELKRRLRAAKKGTPDSQDQGKTNAHR